MIYRKILVFLTHLSMVRLQISGKCISRWACISGNWSDWMNNDNYSPLVGDNNSYTNLRGLHQFCETPDNVQCRQVRLV